MLSWDILNGIFLCFFLGCAQFHFFEVSRRKVFVFLFRNCIQRIHRTFFLFLQGAEKALRRSPPEELTVESLRERIDETFHQVTEKLGWALWREDSERSRERGSLLDWKERRIIAFAGNYTTFLGLEEGGLPLLGWADVGSAGASRGSARQER